MKMDGLIFGLIVPYITYTDTYINYEYIVYYIHNITCVGIRQKFQVRNYNNNNNNMLSLNNIIIINIKSKYIS